MCLCVCLHECVCVCMCVCVRQVIYNSMCVGPAREGVVGGAMRKTTGMRGKSVHIYTYRCGCVCTFIHVCVP